MKISGMIILGMLSLVSAHDTYGAPPKGDRRGWPFSWLPISGGRFQGHGGSGPAAGLGPRGPPTPATPQECRCTSRSISLEDKLRLLAADNDHNGDGLVKSEDILYDMVERYGGEDGIVTEGECVRQWSCRYGDTELVAQFICALISSGKEFERNSDFNVPPFVKGLPIANFTANARRRYEKFFEYKCTNKELTMEEKLTKNAANNDFNKDSQVTVADLEYDLANFYDLNKDGNVTMGEWVARWACNYGDSGDFGRFMWNEVTNSFVSSFPVYNFLKLDKPIPLAQFKEEQRQRYETFKTSTLDRYIRQYP